MVKAAVRPRAPRPSRRRSRRTAGGVIPRFIDRAVKADAEVARFKTRSAAGEFLAGLLAKNGWKRAAVAPDALALLPKGARFERVEPAGPAAWEGIEVGIVAADHGIAATGTLVHADRGGDADRLAWTLPPVCVCFLREGNIVAEADELAGVLRGHLRPRGKAGSDRVSFVTGPSRTADIEAELTLGVHGPGRLVILLYGS